MLKSPKEVQHEILNGNVLKAAFLLGWPMMVTSLMQTGYNLADTFWVGHLAEGSGKAIAALNVGWPLIFMFMAFAMGFGTAGTALVSQYTGAGNKKMVIKTSGQMLFFSILLSIALSITGIITLPFLIMAIGPPASIVPTIIAYTSIIFVSIPFMFITVVFTMILRGWGDTVTPMYLNGITLAINAVLDPIMIFGWLGFPEMGVTGAALATLISRIIFAALALHYLFSGKLEIKLNRESLKPDFSLIKRIVRIGLPSSIGMTFTAFGFVVLMFIIARVPYPNPVYALAAYGIGNRIINLTFIIVDGLAFSLTTIVGQNIGAGKYERAKESYWKISLASFGILWMFSAVFVLFPGPIISAFTNDPETIKHGIVFMTIIPLGMPFFSLFRSSVGLFGGSGRTEFNMVMSIVRLWIMRLPLCYILGMSMGAAGVWYGMAISNMLSAMLGVLLAQTVRIDKAVIEKRPEPA